MPSLWRLMRDSTLISPCCLPAGFWYSPGLLRGYINCNGIIELCGNALFFPFSVVQNKKKRHCTLTSVNIWSIHLQRNTQVFPTRAPQLLHSKSAFCFPQPMGKRFSPTMQLLAKMSIHLANLFCGIS